MPDACQKRQSVPVNTGHGTDASGDVQAAMYAAQHAGRQLSPRRNGQCSTSSGVNNHVNAPIRIRSGKPSPTT